jgi:hypothetical protein
MKGMVSKTKELNETKPKNQNKTNFNILYIYVRGLSFIRACKKKGLGHEIRIGTRWYGLIGLG